MRDGRSLKTAAAEAPQPAQRHRWCILLFILLPLGLIFQTCNASVDREVRQGPPKVFTLRHTTNAFKFPMFFTVLFGGQAALPIAVPVGVAAGVITLPFALVADVAAIPGNLLEAAGYEAAPPLGYLIETGDNARLAERLEAGADPNAYFSENRRYYPIPLEQAIRKRNYEAFEILLAHGAAMQKQLWDDGFGGGFGHNDFYHVELLPFYRRLLEAFPDYPFNEGYYAKSMVQRYCEYHYVTHPSEAPVVDEMLEVMLERGLDPNCVCDARLYPLKATALDCLLFQTEGMAPERRERLVALLRRHGALRLPEIWQGDPEKPSLSIEGIAYDSAFAPVIEMLKYTSCAPFYRFSTEYPGVEEPVLVVDFGRYKDSKAKGEIVFRQTLEEARNGSPPEEDMNIDMAFEVPVCMRMVLTLPGRKVPSRLEALPRKGRYVYEGKMWEEWLTFPTCEIYVEHAKTFHGSWQPTPELWYVLWHGANYAKQEDKSRLHHVLDVFMHLDRIPPPGAEKE